MVTADVYPWGGQPFEVFVAALQSPSHLGDDVGNMSKIQNVLFVWPGRQIFTQVEKKTSVRVLTPLEALCLLLANVSFYSQAI